MSTPMTADQTIAQLKKWGVPHNEQPGWRTRNRAGHGDWGPVYGCVTHHTGDDAPDTADRSVIVNGRADLPGPLAQFGMADTGVVDLIGCGRANHAGGGDASVLKAVMHESYRDYPPAPHEHEGSAGAVDGNTHFYGCENYYSGGHPMSAAAYATLVLLWAAICDFHGWTAKSVIGHKEWSDWKSDPGHVDMKVLRADVDVALKAGPKGVGAAPDRQTPKHHPAKTTAPAAGSRGKAADQAITDVRAISGGRRRMTAAKAALKALLGIDPIKK